MPKPISRRTLLKGAGLGGGSLALGLPWLEAMASSAEGNAPLRTAFFYVPNGIHMDQWRISETGELGTLPAILQPIEHLKQHVVAISDLAADHCDGKGAAHEPAGGGFLIGARCKHSEDPEVANASIDQVIAQHGSGETPVESLALGIDPGHRGDHGYSGTYMSHISWRSKSTPVPLELNPKHLYERLFHGKSPRRHQPSQMAGQFEDPEDQSILDLVRNEAKGLRRQVGYSDRCKLDEYFEGLRSIESRIKAASRDSYSHHRDGFVEDTARHDDDPGLETLIIPDGKGIPAVYADHVNLMLDILILAFQTDTTRFSSFLFSYEKSGRSYREIGAPGAHHSTSHHLSKEENFEQLTRINTHHMQLFARFLDRLKATPEGDASLLDHTMILYGSGISDGNRHNHDDLPILVAGGSKAGIVGGRHLKLGTKTPICNLYVDLMQRMGMSRDSFGDSTGRLPGLSG
jgi:hypothetical protein